MNLVRSSKSSWENPPVLSVQKHDERVKHKREKEIFNAWKDLPIEGSIVNGFTFFFLFDSRDFLNSPSSCGAGVVGRRWALQPAGWGFGSQKKKKKKIQIIPDCSGWSLAIQTLHRQIWKFRGRRPLPVSAFPRRHQRAVANTLRRRVVRQHGLLKRRKAW